MIDTGPCLQVQSEGSGAIVNRHPRRPLPSAVSLHIPGSLHRHHHLAGLRSDQIQTPVEVLVEDPTITNSSTAPTYHGTLNSTNLHMYRSTRPERSLPIQNFSSCDCGPEPTLLMSSLLLNTFKSACSPSFPPRRK